MHLVNSRADYKIITWLLLYGFGVFSYLSSWFNFSSGGVLLRGVVALVCIVTIMSVSVKKFRLFANKLNVVLFLFLLIFSMRLYIDSISGKYNFNMSTDTLMLKFFSLAWISFITVSILNIKEIPIKVSQITLLIICVLALGNGFSNGFGERLSGNNILNPIALGAYAGMLLIITFYSVKVLSTPLLKPTNFISVVIGTLVVALSLSRGVILATGIVVLTLFYSWNSGRKALSNIGFVLCLGVGLIAVFTFDYGVTADRIKIDLGTGDSDGEARVILWFIAFKNIIANPFFGSSVTTEIGYVHNIYLESIMAIGLCGSLFLFYPLWAFRSRYNKAVKFKRHISCSVYLFIFHATACFFSGTVYNSEFFWITLPMALNSLAKDSGPTAQLKIGALN